MRTKLFIIIILFLVLLPNVPNRSYAQTNFQSQSQGDFNFSALPMGSYPSNGTWIGFYNSPVNPYSGISVQNSTPGKGLNISLEPGADGISNFFNATMDGGSNFTVKITFSWNDYYNLFYTEDNIFLSQNSSNLLRFYFGPHDSGKEYLQGRTDSEIGNDPVVSSYYTAEISWNQFGPGTAYFSLNRGYNVSGNFPIRVELNSSLLQGPVNLSFGGLYSNITLYNIYVCQENQGFTVPVTMNSSYSTLSSGNVTGETDSGTVELPNLDPAINTISYVVTGKDPRLEAWNYENGTHWNLSPLPSMSNPTILQYGTNSDEYITCSNASDLALYDLNLTDLNVTHLSFNGYFPAAETLILVDGNLILQSNRSYMFLNISNAKTRYLSISADPSDLIVQSVLSGNTINGIEYNSSSGNFDSFHVNCTTMALTMTASLMQENGLIPLAVLSDNGGLFTAMERSQDRNDSYFIMNADMTEVLDPNLEGINSTGTCLAMGSKLIAIMQDGIMTETSLSSFGITGASIYVPSYGALSTADSVELFCSGVEPLSGLTLSGYLQKVGIITHSESVPFSVNSSLPYKLTARLGNCAMQIFNHSILINVTGLASGLYSLNLSGTNLAGYSFSTTETVTIDLENPLIQVTPGNGSYVSQVQQFAISVTNSSSAGRTVVTSGNESWTFQSSSFKFNVTCFSQQEVVWVNYTDQLGITSDRYFSYTVVQESDENLSVNIQNGSYLDSNNISLIWTPVQYASRYDITTVGAGGYASHYTSLNETKLNLPNGNFTLWINCTLLSGQTETVGIRHFTIETFRPLLSVNFSSTGPIAFYGNSSVNSLTVDARTNVTSMMQVRLFHNGSIIGNWYSDTGYIHLFLDGRNPILACNGIYEFDIIATGMSGMNSERNISLVVNNSMPYLPQYEHPIYANTTMIGMPFAIQEGVSYEVSTLDSGIWSPCPFDDTGFELPSINKTYTVIINATGLSGNHATTSFTVVDYNASPSIVASVGNHLLRYRNDTSIRFDISDPAALGSVTIGINNGTPIWSGNGRHGNVTLSFAGNGIYSLMMKVQDMCGNTNETFIRDIEVSYYVNMTGLQIEDRMFMGFSLFHANAFGSNLQNVNYTWTSGGRSYHGASFSTLLLPGYHTVTLTASFDGENLSTQKRLFTFGFIPEMGIIAIGSAGFIANRARYTDSVDLAEKTVLANLGSELKSIMNISRKARLRKSSTAAAIARLAKENRVVIKRDLDGVQYVMEFEKEREKII